MRYAADNSLYSAVTSSTRVFYRNSDRAQSPGSSSTSSSNRSPFDRLERPCLQRSSTIATSTVSSQHAEDSIMLFNYPIPLRPRQVRRAATFPGANRIQL
ncbi:hypothetical protein K7432_008153 [Basidiobolus ranarum]|uniref:Uncharacterized protein n=1 Tax=Basidiobolus ranarum TaxID=34480 RepID=A0ABR2WSI6_9FUNG